MQAQHHLFGARRHRGHCRAAIAARCQLVNIGAARTRDLVARDVRLEADRLVNTGVDDKHVHAAFAKPLTQERVLDAFRIERAEQDDRHACSASGSTPRKRR